MTKSRKCANCGKPATLSLTPDLDIKGIPLCDSALCRTVVSIKLYESALPKKKLKEDERS